MMTQKEAVYNAVASTVELTGEAISLTKEQTNAVIDNLVTGFNNGEIQLSSNQENIRKYCGGLLNNWLRKDKRLNGGEKYQTKNPGSRAGSQDDVVKNLRLLMKSGTLSEEQKTATQAAITERIAALKPKKEVAIDMSVIPEELKQSLGL